MNLLKSAITFYKEMNPATLSGAIDIIVVRQKNGDLKSTPFHVQFGKLKLLRPKQNLVEISVNGVPVDILMKIGDAGEAFFVVETEKVAADDIMTSPIQKPVDPGSNLDLMEPLDLDGRASESDKAVGSSVKKDTPSPERAESPETTTLDEIKEGQVKNLISQTEKRLAQHQQQQLQLEQNQRLEQQQLQQSQSKPVPPGLDKLKREKSAEGVWKSFDDIEKQLEFIETEKSGDNPWKSSSKKSSDTENSDNDSESPQWSWRWGRLPVKGDERPQNLAKNNQLVLAKEAKNPANELQQFQTLLNQTGGKNFDLEIPDAFLPENLPDEITPDYVLPKDAFDIELSLCGEYIALDLISPLEADEYLDVFYQYEIQYEKFCLSPNLANDPNLMARINGRLFRAPIALPFILSLSVYNKPLTKSCMKNLIKQNWKDRAKRKSSWMKTWFRKSEPATPASTAPTPPGHPPLSPSNSANNVFATSPLVRPNTNSMLSVALKNGNGNGNHVNGNGYANSNGQNSTEDLYDSNLYGQNPPSYSSSPVNENPSPISNSPSQPVSFSSFVAPTGSTNNLMNNQSKPQKYVKSIRLTSDQLKSLNLKEGSNMITFSVEGRSCSAFIYLWDYKDHVVISDIDGTITRSDTLGHIFTAVGKDWTHYGVANLYTNIEKNGYKILYVTSRAIGQSGYTRDFLKWVEQSGGWRLPDGPCICAPDRLLAALHREVIKRQPQEFKIACLKDVLNLFEENPFYAGFGNRITDAISYKTVGVPVQRIFTINPQGDIKAELASSISSSYKALNEIVDQMFPPLNVSNKTKEEFNDFNYWKPIIPEISLDIDDDLPPKNEAPVNGGYPFYEKY